jgi:FixJ family two-component response regulator
VQHSETLASFAQIFDVQTSAISFPIPQTPQNTAVEKSQVIYMVDDDAQVREALAALLMSLGRKVVCFASAQEYLMHPRTDSSACLILDMALPDVSGIELQQRLVDPPTPPIIFLSSRADIPSAVQAMKAGAFEFLTKPVSPETLTAAIDAALAQDQWQRARRLALAKIRQCYSSLTPRERQVFSLVTSGMLNKQAAAALGITEVTLQVHRGQVMRKMAARSFAELARMAEKLSSGSCLLPSVWSLCRR